jgi:CubicO group peptidase (beta-lactamase class C family)
VRESHARKAGIASLRAVLAALALATAASANPNAAALPSQQATVPWPTLGWPRSDARGADHVAIETALGRLFQSKSAAGVPDTRAVLVVQSGRLVVERYASGFDASTRFRSWSAAKSLVNAWVGILVRDGRVSLDEPLDAKEWRARADDPRRAITVRHALQMTTGLDNADGDEGARSFVGRLLFGDLAGDSAHGAADVSLAHEPGTFWAYSTGTTQLLSRLVVERAGEDVADFIAREFAAPLGARSLVVERDRAGTPFGGAFAWASAPDWARFGLLYLRDGVWEGRRILPAGWVDFSRMPAPVPNNGTYGAHLWVNAKPVGDQFEVLRAGIDAFQMSGSAGQYVIVVPGRDLVVVRLGEMHAVDWPGLREPLSDLIEAFPTGGAR